MRGGCTITGMQLRGDALVSTAGNSYTASDATSITAYGGRPLDSGYEIVPWLSAATMQAVVDDVVAAEKDPRERVQFSVTCDRDATTLIAILSSEISDRERVIVDGASIDVTGWLEHIEFDMAVNGYLTAALTVRETG